MRRLRQLAAGVVVSLLAALGGAPAASADIFLEIPGIPGESTAEGQENSIDVLSYSWGAAGGDGARARLQPLNVSKNVDAASPLLFQRLVQGTHIANMELIVTRGGATPFLYLRYCFQDVVVASIQQSDSGPDPVADEAVSFSSGAVSEEYTTQNPAGGAGATVFAGWNATTGELIATYPTPCGL